MAKERTEYRHREAARTDALTGIFNRRGSTAAQVLEQSAAIDLDNFKSINDRFGHAIGDRVLIDLDNFKSINDRFGQRSATRADISPSTAANLPSEGLVGRWGGDEFVAVLYDTGREEAKAAAKRMQSTFQRLAADINGHPVNATLSVGMVFSPEGRSICQRCWCRPTRRSTSPRSWDGTASKSPRLRRCGGRHPQPRPSPFVPQEDDGA